MNAALKEYRKEQLAKANAGQNDYDKLVVALSGGALGLSFTFLKDLANGEASSHTWLLLAAWGCWGLSVAFTLTSIYTGVEALRETVRQKDAGTIYADPPGRMFDKITALLNPGAGLLFVFGLVFMMTFVYFNPYGRRQGSEARPTRTTSEKDMPMSNSTIKLTQSPLPGPRPDDPPLRENRRLKVGFHTVAADTDEVTHEQAKRRLETRSATATSEAEAATPKVIRAVLFTTAQLIPSNLDFRCVVIRRTPID